MALSWQAALAETHRVWLSWAFPAALALTTWIIYTLDRVLDGLRPPHPHTLRHLFCARHRTWLLGFLVPGAAWFTLWLAFYRLPAGAMWTGMSLAALTGIYLSLYASQHRSAAQVLILAVSAVGVMFFISALPVSGGFKLAASIIVVLLLVMAVTSEFSHRFKQQFPQELFGSLLFTLGCALGPHFWAIDGHTLLCRETLLLWCLVAFNLASIAAVEVELEPEKIDPEKLPRLIRVASGRRILGWGLLLMCLTLIFGWLGLPPIHDPRLPWTVIACVVLTFGLHLARRRMTPEVHHWLTDLALILPPVAMVAWTKLG